MAVTERLMGIGHWDIQLVEGTPNRILDALSLFGHILITDAEYDPRYKIDSTMKSRARYAGIVRDRQTSYHLGGPGLLAWLGDEQGKGNIAESSVALTNGTFAQWVAAILPPCFTMGINLSPAGGLTLSKTFWYINDGMTPRGVMDWLVTYFGAAYRVNPTGTFDSGAPSDLFKVTPTAIVQRLPGGRDGSIVGLTATQLDYENDADDWSSRVILQGAGMGTSQHDAPSNPYHDYLGNVAVMKRYVLDTNVPNVGAILIQMVAQLATKWSALHSQVTLTSDEYDVGRDVAVGDNIYVYDPQRRLVADPTVPANGVRYRGEVLFPLKLQVLGMTWPIERGLGVYYRPGSGTGGGGAVLGVDYIDLTPYVAWEPPGVTFEVGAAMRRLT